MSATLSNIQDLQTFLKADMYSNDFRPYPPDMARMDPDHLLGLVLEVIPNNSCLLFCATKKNCENVAMMLCKLMVKHRRELSNVCKAQRKALLKELYNDGESKICPILQYTVHFGVAYHHSGLTMDERKLIEDAYSEGVLCLLTCTSTLAAGVNLPAKRVILRSPYVATQLLSRSQYKQMVGRAGRAGIDSSGESILILSDKDRHKALDILSGPIESCHSSLNYDEGKGIRSLVLSAIGLQIVKTTQDVFTMMGHTLLSVQSNVLDVDINNVTKESLQKLLDNGLVIQKRSLSQEKSDCTMHNLEVTPLGRATFKGSVDIDYASLLYTDLQKGEESLVLSSYLHLLYLVTPYDTPNNISPSWMTYFQVMMALNPVELKVAELIGVPESYVAKKVSGQNSRQAVNEFTVRRFYLTLMLYDLWKQRTVWEVAEKFEQPRGFIQNLLSSSASFASCILRFVQASNTCKELEEFWPYQELLGNFVKRLAYCVSAELIPLMEIPGVKLGRAKQLYCTGFRSLSLVASADPDDIVRAIKQIPRKVARQIVASAKVYF
ncbi:hypothetical protein FSP39_019010 [Pinctada imbricata]|uniref:Helicase C-terminal domain-containing protein n=1 Tax=Pinctada imbricata TaxID=66713 RepID=A0AA88Y008_PINIB|nr:hypothetical protein FSP39_019010 [Pinctada imbricata]